MRTLEALATGSRVPSTPPLLGRSAGYRCLLIAAGSPAIHRPACRSPASPLLLQPPRERHQPAPRSMPQLAGVMRCRPHAQRQTGQGKQWPSPLVVTPLWGQEPQTATRVKRMGDAPLPQGSHRSGSGLSSHQGAPLHGPWKSNPYGHNCS